MPLKTLASRCLPVRFVFAFGQSGFAQIDPAGCDDGAPPLRKPRLRSADDVAKKAKSKECSAKADAQGCTARRAKSSAKSAKKS